MWAFSKGARSCEVGVRSACKVKGGRPLRGKRGVAVCKAWPCGLAWQQGVWPCTRAWPCSPCMARGGVAVYKGLALQPCMVKGAWLFFCNLQLGNFPAPRTRSTYGLSTGYHVLGYACSAVGGDAVMVAADTPRRTLRVALFGRWACVHVRVRVHVHVHVHVRACVCVCVGLSVCLSVCLRGVCSRVWGKGCVVLGRSSDQ